MEGEESGGVEGLRLWGLQLRFLCRFGRHPIMTFYSPSERPLATLPTAQPGAKGAARRVPLLDPPTGTHGATGEDVDVLYAKMLRWLLTGPVSALTNAALAALNDAHASATTLAISHMKSAVAEMNAAHAKESKPLFSFGAPKPPPEALPDLYYQGRVLRLLAEGIGKTPPAELAKFGSGGGGGGGGEGASVGHQLPVATLEEVCTLWLRDRETPKAHLLNGHALRHAATLMTIYLRLLAVRAMAMGPLTHAPWDLSPTPHGASPSDVL